MPFWAQRDANLSPIMGIRSVRIRIFANRKPSAFLSVYILYSSLLLGFLLLGYISPYQSNTPNYSQIQEKEVKYSFETSNIQQELTDADKEWLEADLVEEELEEWTEVKQEINTNET